MQSYAITVLRNHNYSSSNGVGCTWNQATLRYMLQVIHGDPGIILRHRGQELINLCSETLLFYAPNHIPCKLLTDLASFLGRAGQAEPMRLAMGSTTIIYPSDLLSLLKDTYLFELRLGFFLNEGSGRSG